MKLNLTLLVQALNFFITYLFLRVLILRPVFRLIEDAEASEERLRSKLNLLRGDAEAIKLGRTRAWMEHCSDVAGRAVKLLERGAFPCPPSEAQPPSPEGLNWDGWLAEAERSLVNRLKNVE